VKSFVVDASVAAKWFLPAAGEPLASEAEELLDHYTQGRVRFLVPDLFWAELGNVLWKAATRGRITAQQAERSIARARQLGLLALPSVDLLVQALTVAFASGRSVYDSIYVAAAIAGRVDLLTADERLVSATGARFPVRWLGALPGGPLAP
jgi:predicted nucleic acid-binding protein